MGIANLLDGIDDFLEFGGMKKAIVLLAVSGGAIVADLFLREVFPFEPSLIAVVLCGIPIILGAFTSLVREHDIRSGLLVSMAIVASVCIDEIFAAAEIAFIMQLGELLEDITVDRARTGISRLMEMAPKTARIVDGTSERTIPVDGVRVGDILRVLPGDRIPVDGVITRGQTSIDQSPMTGEPVPADKTAGDPVMSGCNNLYGSFEMRATRTGADSSIQRMAELVNSADAGKAKIVRLADRWATIIVIAALATAVATYAVTGEIIRAVTVLVVFCPCALVLATPTAIMAAIGNLTRRGVLVKEGDALERLASVSHMAFDKTGTLTAGFPEVTCVRSTTDGYNDDDIYGIAACVESLSEHPLGSAIVGSWKKAHPSGTLRRADKFEIIPGRGVKAVLDDENVIIGNAPMLDEHGIGIADEIQNDVAQSDATGATTVYVAIDGRLCGYITMSDAIRERAAKTISEISATGVHPLLLTGDNITSATHIASSVGISEIRAGCLPVDKLRIIDEYEKSGRKVCMIGDGINDAPALRRSFVGIAMGHAGNDMAIDASDMALTNDDISSIPFALKLSVRMMRTIRCNLSLSMLINFAAISLAVTGIITPVVGALIHNGGSLLVIANSALLLKKKA